MRLTRQPGARFASACFVTGALDPFDDRAAFLAAARRVQDPMLMLYGPIRRLSPGPRWKRSRTCRGSKAGSWDAARSAWPRSLRRILAPLIAGFLLRTSSELLTRSPPSELSVDRHSRQRRTTCSVAPGARPIQELGGHDETLGREGDDFLSVPIGVQVGKVVHGASRWMEFDVWSGDIALDQLPQIPRVGARRTHSSTSIEEVGVGAEVQPLRWIGFSRTERSGA